MDVARKRFTSVARKLLGGRGYRPLVLMIPTPMVCALQLHACMLINIVYSIGSKPIMKVQSESRSTIK